MSGDRLSLYDWLQYVAGYLVLLGIGMIVVYGLITEPLIESVSERIEALYDTEAWVVCEDFVKEHLKAPATAEFPSFD